MEGVKTDVEPLKKERKKGRRKGERRSKERC